MMKQIIYLLVLLLPCCIKDKSVNESIIACIVVDITDPHEILPEAIPILSLYNFGEHSEQAAEFSQSCISNKLLNPVYKFAIKAGTVTEQYNYKNDRHYREKLIRTFYDSATVTINVIKKVCDTSSESSSECFNAISKQLHYLMESNATRKYLIVYSNLFENTEAFSCYRKDDLKLLKSNPDSIASLLNHLYPLPASLAGVKIYFVYKPITRQDDALYALMNRLYTKLLEDRHAKVITQAQNSFIDR